MRRFLSFSLVLLLAASGAAAETSPVPEGTYVGASGGVALPGGGGALRRAASVGVRAGRYLTENAALEVEGFSVPRAASGAGGATVTGAGAFALVHAAAWDLYDGLFGCERFDPFLVCGVQAAFASRHVYAHAAHRTALGPAAGVGAFYHLTERWSLRAEARAALACDAPCGVDYAVTVGLQCALGGTE